MVKGIFWLLRGKCDSLFSPLQEQEELLLLKPSSSLFVTERLRTVRKVEQDREHVIRAALRCLMQRRADAQPLLWSSDKHVYSAT